MTSTINQVFNFNPQQTIVQSGTYTIPVGFFAHVNIFFDKTNTGSTQRTILLNGSVILQDLNTILSNSSTSFSSLVFSLSTSTYPTTPYLNKLSGVEEMSTTGSGFAYNMQTPNKLTLFLKAGDVLSGSGKYVISLFSNQNSSSVGFKFFNYCPSQTIIASSSYTVPAGKHARALLYFLPQTYAPSSISDYPSVNTLTVNGANVYCINNKTAYEFYTYYDDKSATQITNDYTRKNKGFEPPRPLEFELKAGDVISGSGTWRAIVSLYDIPT